MKKKTVLSSLVVFAVAAVAVGAMSISWEEPSVSFKGQVNSGNITLVGSSTDAKKLPPQYVFANSTNTDPVVDGGTVTQLVNAGGMQGVSFSIAAVGGTATSTLAIRPQGSFDGTNYFDFIGSSTSTEAVATSTIDAHPYVWTFDPGVSTTTVATHVFDTRGFDYVRFLFLGEDVTTDPADGVQAWITAHLIDQRD